MQAKDIVYKQMNKKLSVAKLTTFELISLSKTYKERLGFANYTNNMYEDFHTDTWCHKMHT